MTQYVATIGHLEPSYVIRKFLDAQRIHNLTSYLEQLHEQVPHIVWLSVWDTFKCMPVLLLLRLTLEAVG